MLTTDDYYALSRIIEILPVADTFLTNLQTKLSDDARERHGDHASHLSGTTFTSEMDRVETLISTAISVSDMEWGLANVYTIARRRLRQLPDGHSEREWWQHVVRIAEDSGVRQPGVLRRAVPTEITDGSGARTR